MEVKDVINIIDAVIDENNSADTFNDLYLQYRDADDDKKEIQALQLWEYMKTNNYLPEHFDSDDDLDMASMLEGIALNSGDILAYKYAIVLLYHRFMLSDILEKAFVSRMLLFFFMIHSDLTKFVLQEFISAAFDDIIYKDCLEEDDNDVSILRFELIRAILPTIEWFHNNYPDQEIHGIDEETLTMFHGLSEDMAEKKHALPKFSAFCRYLYESIHSA